MALHASVSVKKLNGHPRYKWRCTFKENGTRKQRYFRSKKQADKFKGDREKEIRAIGVDSGITDAERSAINDYRERMAKCGVTLRRVLEVGLEQFEHQKQSITISELFRRVIEDRIRGRKSEKYLDSLEGNLSRFEKKFGDRAVASLDRTEIADWLHSLKLAPATTNTYRKHLVVAFGDAVLDGYLASNPAEQVKSIKDVREEVGILTPLETARLLESSCDEIRAAIAIGAFAGLRDSEIKRLQWNQVDLEQDLILLTAQDTKRNRRRTVEISSNLHAWLAPIQKNRGSLWPHNGRKLHESAKRRAGFGNPNTLSEKERKKGLKLVRPWPANALRHSFGSYHLAHHKNAPKTAFEMGQRDVNVLYEHYREVVTPSDAELYWKISPAFGSAEIE